MVRFSFVPISFRTWGCETTPKPKVGKMGNWIYHHITNPDTAPDYHNPPTFEPLDGFPNGRKERVSKVTWEEMEAAGVPLSKRDYCADRYIKLLDCRNQSWPFTKHACHHDEHGYFQCEYEDHVLRLKEYERERRLQERAKRMEKRRKSIEIE